MEAGFWNRDRTDPTLLRDNAKILYDLRYQRDPLGYFNVPGQSFFFINDSLQILPSTIYYPRVLVDKYGDEVYIWINGTDNYLQTAGLVTGYLSGKLGEYGFGECYYFSVGAKQILSLLGDEFFNGITNIWINAHSHGAGIASVMALELDLRMQKEVKLTTFGCPRPGNYQCQRALASIAPIRIFASNDPVPYTPPHTGEAYTLAVILSDSTARLLNQQVQPPTGIILSSGGVLVQQESGEYPNQGAILSLLNWATGVQCYGSPDHDISRYLALLQLAVSLIPPLILPVPVADYTQPEERTRRRANAEERQGEAILAADAENPAGQTQTYQVQPVPATQPRPYRKAKRGGIWVVLFHGEVVAVGPGKRRAGSLARKFNRAARAATA
jgi:hypothetical protein